jgi:hypothetical protein
MSWRELLRCDIDVSINQRQKQLSRLEDPLIVLEISIV